MRGVSFESLIGPGVSARSSCMPPTPSIGSSATASTTMPMPPSHSICTAVIQQRLRHRIEAAEHGRAGRRESGDGFEDRHR